MSEMYDDILWKLRIPLPYNLQGLTTKDLSMERREAANEIERLRIDLDYWYERCTRAEACANIMHNKLNRKWWKR